MLAAAAADAAAGDQQQLQASVVELQQQLFRTAHQNGDLAFGFSAGGLLFPVRRGPNRVAGVRIRACWRCWHDRRRRLLGGC